MLCFEHHYKFRTFLYFLEPQNYTKLWVYGNWGRTETGDTTVPTMNNQVLQVTISPQEWSNNVQVIGCNCHMKYSDYCFVDSPHRKGSITPVRLAAIGIQNVFCFSGSLRSGGHPDKSAVY